MACHMRRATWAAVLAALLVCTFVPATHTTPQPDSETETASQADVTSSNSNNNYNCPEDCHCVLAQHTHRPLLHAKCASLKGLVSAEPVRAPLPIHSVDLSYLNLTRLAHALEKLHDVTSVDLSHNELHELGHLGRRIKKLNLKHNRLTSAKLAKLPAHVQVLNLQHNDITHLPLEFTRLSQLQSLELSQNSINCSCDTLEVRNWLQERHVFMEHPVQCSYPLEHKGKPWLQIKQADVCEKERRGVWSADEDENELMLADQPVEGSGDNDEEDELGKAYMPLELKPNGAKSSSEHKSQEDVEGSGDLDVFQVPPMGLTITTEGPQELRMRPHTESDVTEADIEEQTEAEDDTDGSGSGAGIFFIPHLAREPVVADDFDAPDSEEVKNEDDLSDNRPVEQPVEEASQSPAIFGAGMGIFDGASEGGTLTTDKPVTEEVIVPVVHHEVAASNLPDDEVSTSSPDDANDEVKLDAIKHAKVGSKHDDSNAIYFLLGVIALIVVGLILFVGIKRCKQRGSGAHDAENQRQTELLDMDKKQLGKPLQRNGNEHAPLIGEKTKSDLAKPINGSGKPAYDAAHVPDGGAQQQPLLQQNSNGNTAAEPKQNENEVPKVNAPSENEQAPHEYHPITPRYPTPKSPRASKYAQHPPNEQNNNNTTDDTYLPSSPKLGRYSPVYSPETGRVKIKLTETPKPKTPMLVTRSRSNAGDIITTPVRATANGGVADVPAVHVPPAGGGGGSAANGHMH